MFAERCDALKSTRQRSGKRPAGVSTGSLGGEVATSRSRVLRFERKLSLTLRKLTVAAEGRPGGRPPTCLHNWRLNGVWGVGRQPTLRIATFWRARHCCATNALGGCAWPFGPGNNKTVDTDSNWACVARLQFKIPCGRYCHAAAPCYDFRPTGGGIVAPRWHPSWTVCNRFPLRGTALVARFGRKSR